MEARTLVRSSVFPAACDAVWERLRHLETLRFVAFPFAVFRPADGAGDFVWREGESFSLRLALFGLVPLGTHRITVELFDKASLSVCTREKNALVPVWNHRIRLEPLGGARTRYTDEVEIGAGWRTAAVFLWARAFYAHRQRKWLRLLSRKESAPRPAVFRDEMSAVHGTGNNGDSGAAPWLQWAVELQALAQAGLAYGKDAYDVERYARIREIAAEMMSRISDIPVGKVRGLFCNESGYQTPKIDTRAVVFEGGRILLVRENSGKWSLPGGWCDVNMSVGENTVKETKEEAGLDVAPERIIAVQDRARHNLPPYAYGVCKIFIQCRVLGGKFGRNTETTESRFFAPDELPELASEKNNEEQLKMCFSACLSADWKPLLD